ncbi:conserved hypothetical protein [Streptomyces viridochromogenes DSM 40736]|nr:conserved hypothetical protein [Streptomyces viridochromogenes DSM 40736]
MRKARISATPRLRKVHVRPGIRDKEPERQRRPRETVQQVPRVFGGTIPAGAGSRVSISGLTRWLRDHPRGCGEQRQVVRINSRLGGPSPRVREQRRTRRAHTLAVGLSPRVRGADRTPAGFRGMSGTIPAGAGSSRSCWAWWSTPRDHPRGCGEQRPVKARHLKLEGPSPRVRGAEPGLDGPLVVEGTIPAGAGSSRVRPSRPTCRWDHPRGCGEQ